MKKDIFKVWLPVQKTEAGGYKVILSDTSLDRQNELMSKSVIKQIVEKSQLVALANHDNSMQSWVGGFGKMEEMEKNGHHAAVAEPWFFSKQANPLAAQIEKQVEESLEKGLNPGISIGARALKHETIKRDGKSYLRHTEVEALEGTWTPIGANKGSFAYIEKSFNDSKIIKEETMEEKKDETTEETEESTEESKEEESTEGDSKSESSDKSVTDVSKIKHDKEEKEVKDEKKKEKKPNKMFTEQDVQKMIDNTLTNRESFLKAIRESSSDDTEHIEKEAPYLQSMLSKAHGGT